VNIFAVFGATNGILTYLHRTRIPINQNWFAKPAGSVPIFMVMTGGGYLVGGLVGLYLFRDPALLRLQKRHTEDIKLNTAGAKY
jgi:hypothetical protein